MSCDCLIANELEYRIHLVPSDREAIETAVRGTGFFTAEEVAIAVELADDALAKGDASEYLFIVAMWRGRFVGYACYGHIPGTETSFDLYWIAVASEFQAKGAGKAILRAAEQAMRDKGATRIYIDTSDKAMYAPTQRFYLGAGYHEAARLADFYAPADGKIIYLKVLQA